MENNEFEEGYYYVAYNNGTVGIEFFDEHCGGFNTEDIFKVICKVPTFEEFEDLKLASTERDEFRQRYLEELDR